MAAPNTSPPAFVLPATEQQTPAPAPLQETPPARDADTIIEAARLEAAKEAAAAKDAAAQDVEASATAAGAPPAEVILALAQPGDLPPTIPDGTQQMEADSCLKRLAAEEAASASEDPAKRLREH
eukprot:5734909-Amphidinium_carterae.1